MGNETIVIVSVCITAIIAAAVFTSSYDIEDSDPVQPPSMLMEVDGEVVRGLEGDFCWESDNGTACISKLDPEQLSTRLAAFSTTVSPDATYDFYPANYTSPKNLTVEVWDSDGTILSEHRYEPGMSFSLSTEEYLLVTRATWDRGNVTHVFQIEVETGSQQDLLT